MVEAAKCAVEVVKLLCDQLDHILQREPIHFVEDYRGSIGWKISQAGQGLKNTFVISIEIIISNSDDVCMSYSFANFLFRLISCVTSQTIEQSGLEVKFLEHPVLERLWHCVNTPLDAPD